MDFVEWMSICAVLVFSKHDSIVLKKCSRHFFIKTQPLEPLTAFSGSSQCCFFFLSFVSAVPLKTAASPLWQGMSCLDSSAQCLFSPTLKMSVITLTGRWEELWRGAAWKRSKALLLLLGFCRTINSTSTQRENYMALKNSSIQKDQKRMIRYYQNQILGDIFKGKSCWSQIF